MQSDIKTKIAAIKKALFQQETKLKDQEQSAKDLSSRLDDIRLNVI